MKIEFGLGVSNAPPKDRTALGASIPSTRHRIGFGGVPALITELVCASFILDRRVVKVSVSR